MIFGLAVGDPERAVAARAAVAGDPALERAEHRLDVGPAPAGIAGIAPVVEIAGQPARIDHRVDRTRAAEHLAARHVDDAVAEAGVGEGLEAPVDRRVEEGLAVADRGLDPEAEIAAAGLDQQDRAARIGAQPVGDHATGGPGPNDDVVELLQARPPSFRPWQTCSARDVDTGAAVKPSISNRSQALFLFGLVRTDRGSRGHTARP